MSFPYPVVKTPPAFEPLTLEEAKDHLRVYTSDEDALILNYVRSARRALEWKYNRAFLTQSLILSLDTFGQPGWWPPISLYYAPSYVPSPMWGIVELRPPLQSVTTVTYVDPTGTTQTLASSRYVVDTYSEPGRMAPSVGSIWPITGPIPGAVKIEFVSGYTTANLIPDDMKEALRMLVGNWFENRESVVVDTRLVALELPQSVQMLMAPYQENLVR